MAGSPRVISIAGRSGSGKSTLAKALVQALGPDQAARVPADHYLMDLDHAAPTTGASFRWDWARLSSDLLAPEGTVVETPDFDFKLLRRCTARGGMTFTRRPVLIVDAMMPFPGADIVCWLAVPAAERLRRVRERDRRWGSRIADRWDAQEAASPAEPPPGVSVMVDGTRTIEVIVADLVGLIGAGTGVGRAGPDSPHDSP
ncbi:MAG TPA: hypothetical protein VGT61_14295 [Thermomicrobiales bacterium]|nr:hypothetical protein [Thermomicrobiales bacterium]